MFVSPRRRGSDRRSRPSTRAVGRGRPGVRGAPLAADRDHRDPRTARAARERHRRAGRAVRPPRRACAHRLARHRRRRDDRRHPAALPRSDRAALAHRDRRSAAAAGRRSRRGRRRPRARDQEPARRHQGCGPAPRRGLARRRRRRCASRRSSPARSTASRRSSSSCSSSTRPPRLRLAAVNVHRVIQEVLLLERAAGVDDACRALRLRPQPARRLADEAQLRQVFLNLVQNASRRWSAPARSPSAPAWRPTSTSCATGTRPRAVPLGRDRRHRARHRRPRTASASSRRSSRTKTSGTGLGLAVSAPDRRRSTAALIRAESEPGRGTRVPRDACRSPRTGAGRLSDGTILVADDEESIRWVLGTALAQAGHDVETVATGGDALARARPSGDVRRRLPRHPHARPRRPRRPRARPRDRHEPHRHRHHRAEHDGQRHRGDEARRLRLPHQALRPRRGARLVGARASRCTTLTPHRRPHPDASCAAASSSASRSSARARRCRRSTRRSAGWRRPTPPCSSRARAAPARS